MRNNYEKGKAILFERPRKAAVKRIRLAEVDEETVVVKTKYSGISSGTDMAIYTGIAGALDGNLWYPLVPGYEEVGEVVYVGQNAMPTAAGEKLKIGDRVMANDVYYFPDYCSAWGGQCEYAIKNRKTSPGAEDACAKIPDGVSYQEAVVAYLACIAKKGIDKVGIDAQGTVLIVGMGNIGLSAVQLAKIYGAKKVIAMDIHQSRLNLAKSFTAHLIDSSRSKPVDALKEMNNGELADIVVECSGNAEVVPDLYKYVRQGGRIHLVGQYRTLIIIDAYHRWNGKDLTISCTCGLNPGDKEAILRMISDGRFDARGLYTKEYSVDEAPRAYEELEENRYDILKILFRW